MGVRGWTPQGQYSDLRALGACGQGRLLRAGLGFGGGKECEGAPAVFCEAKRTPSFFNEGNIL